MNLTDDAAQFYDRCDAPVINSDVILHRLSRLMIYLIKRQL